MYESSGAAEGRGVDGRGREARGQRSPRSSPDSKAASSAEVPLATRKQELYDFFTQTIRELLGLRGYLLQLTVERADTLDDYRDIRDRFLVALEKAKGPEIARALRERIDRMLA